MRRQELIRALEAERRFNDIMAGFCLGVGITLLIAAVTL